MLSLLNLKKKSNSKNYLILIFFRHFQRNFLTLNYFNMVHGAMTIFILFCGFLFANIFGSIEVLIVIIVDTAIRIYFFFCIFALTKVFKTEEMENNLLNANASQEESHRMSMYSETDSRWKRNSYGFDLYMNGVE